MPLGEFNQQYHGEDETGPNANRRVPDDVIETNAEVQTSNEQVTAEAAGDVGDDAVEAAVTKIPISYEDTVKGEAGNEAPGTQQWRAENWEHNKNRAEWMAHDRDSSSAMEAVSYLKGNAQSLKDEAVKTREKAQEKRNIGVMTHGQARDYRANREEVWRLDQEAQRNEWDAERKFKEAQIFANKAGRVYDAKQTIDHELEPLSEQDSKVAEELRDKNRSINEVLTQTRAEYREARNVEDAIDEAKATAEKLDRAANDLGKLYGGDSLELKDDQAEEALVAYFDCLKKMKEEVKGRISKHADKLLRLNDLLEKSDKDQLDHYTQKQGAYYDSALSEMTDKAIPFNIGEQAQVEPTGPEVEVA